MSLGNDSVEKHDYVFETMDPNSFLTSLSPTPDK